MKNYEAETDEALVEAILSGDSEAMDFLMNKYKNLVRSRARTLFLVGADKEDLIQEGMIGLYKAIRDYRLDKEASFYTFANLCVERQIYTAVNRSNRKKHSPLNGYVPIFGLHGTEYEQEELYADVYSEEHRNPEELYIHQENIRYIKQELERKLSEFEMEVLQLYVQGEEYQEIALRLDKTPKAIDNALQRIKGKANRILQEMEN
jgi:RNA polymerase sporulation-specific sigma factor